MRCSCLIPCRGASQIQESVPETSNKEHQRTIKHLKNIIDTTHGSVALRLGVEEFHCRRRPVPNWSCSVHRIQWCSVLTRALSFATLPPCRSNRQGNREQPLTVLKVLHSYRNSRFLGLVNMDQSLVDRLARTMSDPWSSTYSSP